MLNIEKHKDEILKYAGYRHSLMCLIYENIMKKNDCTGNCSKCRRETIEWLTSEYKEPILNEDEKKILRGVIEAIKPFIKISPLITRYNEAYGQTLIVLSYENEYVRLPLFNRDKMFTNLEYEKSYTLKELGL